MRKYTAAQVATAIELIERHGGMTVQAIDAVRAALNAPALSLSTMHAWLKAKDKYAQTPIDEPTDAATFFAGVEQLRPQAAEALDDMFEEAARRYLNHAIRPEIVNETRGKDALMAAAIAVDKMRLLRDLPTEIVAVLPALMTAIERHGLRASDVFNAMLLELNDADGG